ncbi:Succinoglycan biosynthesis protein ExoI [Pseudoruegeria aquimaris]|uniref:Succinoglycan biosynthesis protein ExoI n=1 Tax=Pseudoruegeria aquimaris TaxID=393663 RepID=A0A1Y5RGQ1_9RHOB|nr:thermonuclease family protein [Pseudoruegeria aquimaris]SLN16796.1 Succinoglycan biosynthesis protein ExoI [Pseudoruegeria aquimaris]
MTRLLPALCLMLFSLPAAAAPLSGAVQVTDGDSLRLGSERVRLFGIDAPELDQSCKGADGQVWDCGRWARDELVRIVAGRRLRCERRDVDRYGRSVARCEAGGRDVAAEMVRRGAAMAYRKYALDYVDLEKEAAFAGRGIWAGEVARPEDHRRARTAPEPAWSPGTEGCVIKGNISGNGRIYHLPGQQHYGKVRISTGKGERWFCSEAEARAAGWRRARR